MWGSFEGFGPLFGYVGNYQLISAMPLLWFGVIGIVGGLDRPAIRQGLLRHGRRLRAAALCRAGCVPLSADCSWAASPSPFPKCWAPDTGGSSKASARTCLQIPLWIVLILPFARIATTGLSIGSGGSGGIFGPGMVIGAFVGAAVWRLLEPVVPSLGHDPAPYVIVGMMACFGSISRAPLAVMLMVAEMTGTLSLIVPAMLAVGLATLIVRRSDDTIYRSQLKSRAESPAHRILTGLPLLAQVPVSEAMVPPRCVLVEPVDADRFARELDACGESAAPLTDASGHYLGVVTRSSLRPSGSSEGGAADVPLDATSAPVYEDVHLDVVLEILTSTPQTWAVVIDPNRRVVGTIALSNIVRNYRRTARTYLRQLSEKGGATGLVEVVIAEESPYVGVPLRSPDFPSGVIVTSIERGGDVVNPDGDTVLRVQDRVTALGAAKGLAQLGHGSSARGVGGSR